MPFFKPSKRRKLKRYLHKKGFMFEEGGEHTIATNTDGVTLIIPRHNNISRGVTKKICDKLVEIGFDKDEIEQNILG
jgi:SOS response regulatory protein OraA/RecX